MLMKLERKLVAQKEQGVTHVIVIENEQVVEYLTDQGAEAAYPGALYKGRVSKIFSKWKAALVDIGQNKPAYLDLNDWPALDKAKPASRKGRSSPFPQPGESIIVQVDRQATALKGAKVSGNIQLAGRFLVYLPYGRKIKLSRRIAEQDGQRLISLAQRCLIDGEGLIFHTLATHYADHDLLKELKTLRAKWQALITKADQLSAPALLDPGGTLAERVSRDFFTPELKECVVSDIDLYRRWKEEKEKAPELSFTLTLDDKGHKPLFTRLGLDREIEKLYERQIKLKSGGYLVIEETEALTVIDVNSGGLTREVDQEEGAFITNLEAAQEAARQIRLRDIGGIIVIDFIDLAQKNHREKILERLNQAFQPDRRETHVLGYTALGLVELTRKKKAASLWQATTQPCPLCRGQGRVRKN